MQHEPWQIQAVGDEGLRKAGDNLREWAGDERGQVRRFVDRFVGKDDRDPKLAGLIGEELVGKELAKLGAGWGVVHGVRVGPKADIDHVVVGPPGVFCLNTKRLAYESRVVVTPRQFRVNGYSRDYYPKAVKESCRVEVRLQAAIGSAVPVRPVLVIAGVDRRRITIKQQPDDVTVITRRKLVPWLRGLPPVLNPAQVQLLHRKIRHPATWDPKKAVRSSLAPAAAATREGSAAAVETPLAPVKGQPTVPVLVPPPGPVAMDGVSLPPPPPPPVATGQAGVRMAEWKRYGHHRIYVNCASSGLRLGWRDERTGEVHIEAVEHAGRVRAAFAERRPEKY